MRALVTGATGCLGANVAAALLEKGYAVRAMHRSTSRLDALDDLAVELVMGDLLEPASLEAAMAGCDLVFHVAAVSDYWRIPSEQIYRVNVEGTRNVIDAALQAGVDRLVYTSSVGALGMPESGHPLTEADTFNLAPDRFPYGHSKSLAEDVVGDGVARGLEAVIVNPAAIIGPRDVNWIGGSVLKAAAEGQAWFAPAGGTCWASAVDVGYGHVLAAEVGRAGERYILSGENLPHRQMLNLVAGVVGVRPPFVCLPPALMEAIAAGVRGLSDLGLSFPLSSEQIWLSSHEVYCDDNKAQSELGYSHTPIERAIEQGYQWYRRRGWL